MQIVVKLTLQTKDLLVSVLNHYPFANRPAMYRAILCFGAQQLVAKSIPQHLLFQPGMQAIFERELPADFNCGIQLNSRQTEIVQSTLQRYPRTSKLALYSAIFHHGLIAIEKAFCDDCPLPIEDLMQSEFPEGLLPASPKHAALKGRKKRP
jgi:hypothetical protein